MTLLSQWLSNSLDTYKLHIKAIAKKKKLKILCRGGRRVFVGWTGVIDSTAVTCGANEWPIWTRYTVIRGHAPGGARGPSGGASGGCEGISRGGCTCRKVFLDPWNRTTHLELICLVFFTRRRTESLSGFHMRVKPSNPARCNLLEGTFCDAFETSVVMLG